MRSGLIVSVMTLISRILGLVRDVVVANLMGAGVSADVFFFANKIPNFLRRLFAEGAFAQAFVPVLTEYQETKSDEAVRQLLAKVAGTLGAGHRSDLYWDLGLSGTDGVIWRGLVCCLAES
ncbi:lipid II flippase MurJ [Shewanella dokdonensis]|uniref:lipid II flippase MurJ n=1 Tax=Shewanella dokdonensis TaxID=712036 RepID=UPI003CC7DA42